MERVVKVLVAHLNCWGSVAHLLLVTAIVRDHVLGDLSCDLLSFLLTNCHLSVLVFENIVQFVKLLSFFMILMGNKNANEGEAGGKEEANKLNESFQTILLCLWSMFHLFLNLLLIKLNLSVQVEIIN